MSWGVTFIGKPDKVVEALKKYSEKLSDYSKEEYDKALPNMVNLVELNFGNEHELIQINANGSGYIENGVPKSGRFNMKVEPIYGILV